MRGFFNDNQAKPSLNARIQASERRLLLRALREAQQGTQCPAAQDGGSQKEYDASLMENEYCALHIDVILSREPHKRCRSAKCEESPLSLSFGLGALTEYKAPSER